MFAVKLNGCAAAATMAAGLLIATPSHAVITPFAAYSADGTASNVFWKNNGSSNSNGTGGSFYTIANGAATTAGTARINFSFLQAALSPYVTNVAANFTLLGTVTSTPALTAGGFKIQSAISGSFQILSADAITIGSQTFAAGANLLSGTFNQAAIFGQSGATSGSFSAATTSGATITYTSDFLDFLPTISRDFSLSLTAITAPLASSNGRALRSFRAVSTGSFSSDPAPVTVIGIPETATWAMFIVGFGLAGAILRRRHSGDSLA